MSADDPRESLPDPEPEPEPESPRIVGDRVLFHCGTCGKELRTLRSRAGQAAACPQCGESVVVPETGLAPAPPATDERPPAAGRRECPMCGAAAPPAAAVCKVCGERLPTAAPETTGRRGERFQRQVGTVSLGETFSAGGRLFSEHFGILLGSSLLTGLLLILGGCIVGLPFQLGSGAISGQFAGRVGRPNVETALMMAALQQIGQLLGLALMAFLLAGFVRLRLNLARRKNAKIDDLFSETGVWASAALTTVVYSVITALPGAFAWAAATAGDGGMAMLGGGPFRQPGPGGPVVVFDFDVAWAAVWFLVWCVQTVVSVLFWPYLFLCVDYKMRGFAPLGAAWEVTRGSRLPLLGLTIVQTLIWLVAAIPCGLGFLIAVPYVAALNVAAYEQISGNLSAARRED